MFYPSFTTKKPVNRGFTLIEIMVSISIFTIIMVTGMGALLTITRSYRTSRTHEVVTNGLHFALDSMVRDIRIGNAYYADDFSPLSEFETDYRHLDGLTDVLNLSGIEERGHLRYTLNPDSDLPYIVRYRDDGVTAGEYPLLVNFDDINISNALFRVVGSDPDDTLQPSVFIYLRGEDVNTGASFVLQTFVSQRSLDIR